jgi:hypothetical protein
VLAILPISNTYQFFGLLHVLAATAAFGPLFLYPRLHRAGATQAIAGLHTKFVLPALFLMWVLGMGLAGIGEWDIGQEAWLIASILLWAVAMAASWFLIRPALTDTSDAATGKLNAGVGITHLTLVITLWLMIFQPG